MSARARALLLACLATACASCVQENAFLELDLTLPPAPGGESEPRFAVVRVNTADASFEENWESTDPLPAVPLDPNEPSSLRVSVEGRPEIEAEPLRLKVRFCLDPNCVGIRDDRAPEVRFEVERAFYLGERTSLALSVECIPNVETETDPPPACALAQDSVVEVPKCSVAGCREGVTSSYCVSGKHFCEE